MLKIIVIAVVVSVVAVLAYAWTRPDTFEIHRSASIKAPPEKIFPFLSDFRQAMAWSPYEKKDPEMKRAFSGPASGKGAVYEFEGNKDIGAGRLEILEAVPGSRVTLRLDMHKPFKGSNIIEYVLEPKGATTDMTWSMRGDAPFITRVFCLFMDMDKMVGKDFEAGLASLKSLAEAGAP